MSIAPAWNRGGQYGRDNSRSTGNGRPSLRVVESHVPTAAETISELDQAYEREARALLSIMRNRGITLARRCLAEHRLSCMGLAYCASSDKLTRKRPAE